MQIFAVIGDGDLDQHVRGRDLGREIAMGDGRSKRFCRQHVRTETDHQRARRRHDVDGAVNRIGFQRGKERKRLVEILQFDDQNGQADREKAHSKPQA